MSSLKVRPLKERSRSVFSSSPFAKCLSTFTAAISLSSLRLTPILGKKQCRCIKVMNFISEAYLGHRYYEQSLDHLTTALKLNGSLFSKLEETKQFHSHILTLLGK